LLKKALDGLKQAPRAWYSKIDDHLHSLGFKKSLSESTLYSKCSGADILIISLYVEDLFVTGSKTCLIEDFKLEMMKMFEITDLGLMAYFLGMEIKQNEDDVFICKKKYTQDIIKQFHMEDCKVMGTPMKQKEKLSIDDGEEKMDEAYYRRLIGSLMYLTTTKLDILYAVSLSSRLMHCASDLHLRAAKLIVKYIKGTINYGVKFHKSENLDLSDILIVIGLVNLI